MTVTYSLDVSDAGLATTFRLLGRWRGSIFQVVYREGLIYFACWLLVSLTYRLGLDAEQRRTFEDLVIYCRNWYTMIPVTFILGFYVNVVYSRWQNFVMGLPWTDSTFVILSSHLQGGGEKAVLYRRTIVRYVLAAQVISLRAISLQVKKRFPTVQHIVDAHLLKQSEALTLETSEFRGNMHWLPMQWAISIVNQARRDGMIASDYLLECLVRKLDSIRSQHGDLLLFDMIQIPLVYTQLVSLAVWVHFSFGLFANQWVDATHPLLKDSQPLLDLYFPIFTLMQFICFVGWLRVAQNMLNPLGEGDDDLELNAMLDQNLQKAFLLVDSLHGVHPPLEADGFQGSLEVPSLPHTLASLPFASDGPANSAAAVAIPAEKAKTVSRAVSQASGLSKSSKSTVGSVAASFRQKMSAAGRGREGSGSRSERKLSSSRSERSAKSETSGSETGTVGLSTRLETLEEGHEGEEMTLGGADAPALLHDLHDPLATEKKSLL